MINKEGEYLLKLIEEQSWYITNGNMDGDEKEKFTFMSMRGVIVIDYVIINEK